MRERLTANFGLREDPKVADEPAVLGAPLRALKRWDGHRGKQTDDHDHNHDLDEAEARTGVPWRAEGGIFHDGTGTYDE